MSTSALDRDHNLYRVVSSPNPTRFHDNVHKLLDEGWLLYGPPHVTAYENSLMFSQGMVHRLSAYQLVAPEVATL